MNTASWAVVPPDEIRALTAGRELDALVHNKVRGWRLECGATSDFIAYSPPDDGYCQRCGAVLNTRQGEPPPEHHRADIPHYSTRISDAWLVVEQMRDLGWWVEMDWCPPNSPFGVIFYEVRDSYGPAGKSGIASGEPPFAISRAALLAVLGEGQP